MIDETHLRHAVRRQTGGVDRLLVPHRRPPAGVALDSRLALLWIHGGGLVIGGAAQDDRFCAETARELGITVVSAEYRLAPEHPYPAALVQRLYDEGERPRAQWLFCPMLDDRTAARRGLDGAGPRVWDNRLNRFGWRAYLGTEPGAPVVPHYAVPARRDDVAGLPDTWIGVGDIDLFHDET